MRALFGVLGLLLVVVVIGLLARKQLTAVVPTPLSAASSPMGGNAVPTGAPRQQVQQFQQAVQGAMQQGRPEADETK